MYTRTNVLPILSAVRKSDPNGASIIGIRRGYGQSLHVVARFNGPNNGNNYVCWIWDGSRLQAGHYSDDAADALLTMRVRVSGGL